MGVIADAVPIRRRTRHRRHPTIALATARWSTRAFLACASSDSMHERKGDDGRAELTPSSPARRLRHLGGILEVLTWAQLGLHRKRCALLDVDGYYDPLLGCSIARWRMDS